MVNNIVIRLAMAKLSAFFRCLSPVLGWKIDIRPSIFTHSASEGIIMPDVDSVQALSTRLCNEFRRKIVSGSTPYYTTAMLVEASTPGDTAFGLVFNLPFVVDDKINAMTAYLVVRLRAEGMCFVIQIDYDDISFFAHLASEMIAADKFRDDLLFNYERPITLNGLAAMCYCTMAGADGAANVIADMGSDHLLK